MKVRLQKTWNVIKLSYWYFFKGRNVLNLAFT